MIFIIIVIHSCKEKQPFYYHTQVKIPNGERTFLIKDSVFLIKIGGSYSTGKIIKYKHYNKLSYDSTPFNISSSNIIGYSPSTNNRTHEIVFCNIKFIHAFHSFDFKYNGAQVRIMGDTVIKVPKNDQDSSVNFKLYRNESNTVEDYVYINFNDTFSINTNICLNNEYYSDTMIVDCNNLYLYYSFDKNNAWPLYYPTIDSIRFNDRRDSLYLLSKSGKTIVYPHNRKREKYFIKNWSNSPVFMRYFYLTYLRD